jgi:hypothetical protein
MIWKAAAKFPFWHSAQRGVPTGYLPPIAAGPGKPLVLQPNWSWPGTGLQGGLVAAGAQPVRWHTCLESTGAQPVSVHGGEWYAWAM